MDLARGGCDGDRAPEKPEVPEVPATTGGGVGPRGRCGNGHFGESSNENVFSSCVFLGYLKFSLYSSAFNFIFGGSLGGTVWGVGAHRA